MFGAFSGMEDTQTTNAFLKSAREAAPQRSNKFGAPKLGNAPGGIKDSSLRTARVSGAFGNANKRCNVIC